MVLFESIGKHPDIAGAMIVVLVLLLIAVVWLTYPMLGSEYRAWRDATTPAKFSSAPVGPPAPVPTVRSLWGAGAVAGGCTGAWDSAAVAEAQGLAMAGGYAHDQAESQLQHAISAAY